MAHRNTTLKTAPTMEPVTVAEAKLHMRVDHVVEDSWIASRITAATEVWQEWNNCQLITATWELRLDNFPAVITLPYAPAQSVTSIVYTDTDGVLQTLSASTYDDDVYSEPARIVPAYAETWPSTRNVPNAVKVEYVAGYGTAIDVPAADKQAIAMLLAHWYENAREATIAGLSIMEVPFGVKTLLNRRRNWEFA